MERWGETGNVVFRRMRWPVKRGEVEQSRVSRLHMHGTSKLLRFGVTCSLSGLTFAFCEALETAFQPPSRPLPCGQAVCWRAHHLRVTTMEHIVGIEWDDNGSGNLPCVRMP